MTDYLTLADVLALHADQIERYGGSQGVRDLGALEAALYRPQTGYYADVIGEAAALWESLAQNHPFLDGNKRTGLAAMLVFLGLNGLDLVAEEDHLADVVLGVAAGTTSKAEVAVFIESHTVPRKSGRSR